jgi:hypothetical protein
MRAALSCLLLAACALVPNTGRHSARAIFDAYLIAHGMVKSYDERPDADPVIAQQLATLDVQASRALIGLAPGPNSDPEATARAVAALTDYAAQQTNQTR